MWLTVKNEQKRTLQRDIIRDILPSQGGDDLQLRASIFADSEIDELVKPAHITQLHTLTQ